MSAPSRDDAGTSPRGTIDRRRSAATTGSDPPRAEGGQRAMRLPFAGACSALLLATSGTPAAAEAAGVGLGATCTSPAGYRVDYPRDWAVNEVGTLPACSWFDPEPFTVPEASD